MYKIKVDELLNNKLETVSYKEFLETHADACRLRVMYDVCFL